MKKDDSSSISYTPNLQAMEPISLRLNRLLSVFKEAEQRRLLNVENGRVLNHDRLKTLRSRYEFTLSDFHRLRYIQGQEVDFSKGFTPEEDIYINDILRRLLDGMMLKMVEEGLICLSISRGEDGYCYCRLDLSVDVFNPRPTEKRFDIDLQ